MRRSTRNRSLSGLILVLGVGGAWLHRAQGAPPGRVAASAQPPPLVEAPPLAPSNGPPLAASRALPPPTVPPALDEGSLMAELRRVKDSDPELALALARDGNERFPSSPDAPERAALMVYSLTALGRPSEGRGVAEDMVNRYPDSNWVRQIEVFTGAHRHRNVRVNAEGQLEYY